MSMQILKKSFEEGIYSHLQQQKDADGDKLNPIKLWSADAEKQGVMPNDDQRKAAEDYWLTELRVQPHELRRAKQVREYARQHWQMEAIFADEKLPIMGDESVTALKAFSVTSTQALFPIYYDMQIQAGILAQSLLPLLVMDTITANVGTFDHVSMNETVADRSMGEAGEWTVFKELNISASNAPIVTHKIGGILNGSDEALRRARVPIWAYGVRRIGQQLGILMSDMAIDVALNGDGTAGAAPVVAASASHAANYTDWTSLLYTAPIGYEFTDYVASKLALTRLNVLPQVQDPLAGFMLQRNGGMPALFGMQPHRWDSTGSTTWSNSGNLDLILMFQRNLMLIQYQEGGIVTEQERVMSQEFTRLKSSIYFAFGVWDSSSRAQGTGF